MYLGPAGEIPQQRTPMEQITVDQIEMILRLIDMPRNSLLMEKTWADILHFLDGEERDSEVAAIRDFENVDDLIEWLTL